MKNFVDQPVKNDIRTHDGILKTTTVLGEDCTTGCLLDYSFFK